MLSEADLVKGCKGFSGIAQRELYARYVGKMRGVCIRYAATSDEAQDILQEGFMKVFSNIDKYSGLGSLEGWIRRIMVNTSISHYHKNKKNATQSIQDPEDINIHDDSEGEEDEGMDLIWKAELTQEDLIDALKILSPSYRIVFNMFYLENYSHREIAGTLSIDEKTSRTRLFRGRKQLQKYLYTVCAEKVKVQSDSKKK